MLKRSPDPEEVEDEMQRDKGFGGRKRIKLPVYPLKEEKEVPIALMEDAMMRSPLNDEVHEELTKEAYSGEVHVRKVSYFCHVSPCTCTGRSL